MRHLGGDRFEVHSAGSHPAGFIHPLAVECLTRLSVPMIDLRSKSWDEFLQTPVDAVITLCDSAAAETCPVWPGAPIRAHWSIPDPTYHLGVADERIEFALRIASRLQTKIQGLVDLDWSVNPQEIQKRLEFLGEI